MVIEKLVSFDMHIPESRFGNIYGGYGKFFEPVVQQCQPGGDVTFLNPDHFTVVGDQKIGIFNIQVVVFGIHPNPVVFNKWRICLIISQSMYIGGVYSPIAS